MHILLLVTFLGAATDSTADVVPADSEARPVMPDESGLRLTNIVGATWQNPGIEHVVRGYYRFDLSDSNDVLWRNNHFDVGVVNELSPVFNYAGGFVEIEPIAVLNLHADLQQVTFFHVPVHDASYGYFYYPSGSGNASQLDYSMDYRSERHDLRATSATGWRLHLALRLQAMVWRIAVVSLSDLTYLSIRPRADETYFYDPLTDSIHETTDLDFNTFTFLFFQVRGAAQGEGSLFAGLCYKYFIVRSTQYENRRFGPAFSWELADWISFAEKPTWVLMALWYLDDPYLKGPMPFIGTLLSFETRI